MKLYHINGRALELAVGSSWYLYWLLSLLNEKWYFKNTREHHIYLCQNNLYPRKRNAIALAKYGFDFFSTIIVIGERNWKFKFKRPYWPFFCPSTVIGGWKGGWTAIVGPKRVLAGGWTVYHKGPSIFLSLERKSKANPKGSTLPSFNLIGDWWTKKGFSKVLHLPLGIKVFKISRRLIYMSLLSGG